MEETKVSESSHAPIKIKRWITEDEIRSSLSDLEQTALTEMQTMCEELGLVSIGEKSHMRVDIHCIMRYLRARKFVVKDAIAMLQNTITWRQDYQPHLISKDVIIKENRLGKALYYGPNRDGRSIIILRGEMEEGPPLDEEAILKNIVYTFERAIKEQEKYGQEKYVVITNASSTPYKKMVPMRIMRSFLKIFQSYYPERLHCFIIQDIGYIFTGIIKMLMPFVDPVTKAKLKYSNGEVQKKKIIEEMIGKEFCWEAMGGACELDWDVEKYVTDDREYFSRPKTSLVHSTDDGGVEVDKTTPSA